MKKLFSIILGISFAISMYANIPGHFFMNVEEDNVQVANVENHFAQWLDLPSNTTFTLFRDETDAIGIRHLSYKQSVNGDEIVNAVVLVHAKNGKVFVVNGDIMDATIAAQQLPKKISPMKAAQIVRKKGNSVDAKLKIVRAFLNGETVFRYAYEVLSEDHSAKLYVDAETSEVIKTSPLIYNADVEATAMTMYSGTQTITCFEDNNLYYLHDEGRGIVTLNATNMYDPENEYWLESIYNLAEDSLVTIGLYDYLDDCEEITNPSTTWGGFWMMLLKSVTIESVSQNSNWYTVGEGSADVYIKVKDGTGDVVFTSSRYDDPTFPLTINIGMQVATPPYSIQVWDYDPIGSDDLIETITIEAIRGENKTYDRMDFKDWPTIVDLTCRIESSGRHPFLDAHWGMEKTIDFYREKFNRNSYDNNGSIVYQLVNQPSTPLGLLGSMYSNACAIGDNKPALMIYGMGLNSSKSDDIYNCTRPFVAIDIMAHEFSHLVTNRNGNGGLLYSGESGALNESFSDIMGISILKYATGAEGWLLGTDIMMRVSNMRSMDNPNNSGDGYCAQPDTYGGQNWANVEDLTVDKGGVHINSGVQNYWYYLLCEGGNGTNDNSKTYSVTGIGIDKALQIAYRNLIYYLTPEASFEDARNGSIQAAIDLYGQGSQEHQSVMNAWHAVGVGDRYIDPSEDFELKPGKYVIVASRAKKGDRNWYYMTSDLGTASTKRFQAVSTGTESMDAIDITDLEDKYVWTLEADGSNWKLKNGTQYVTWTSGNSANFGATAKTLTFDVADNQVLAHFNDGSAERYLSLNATTNNNYFAFYSGTNQVEQLFFLPYDDGTTPSVESERYIVLAQRSATSNWLYMTSDLGTASNKRYQAIDAGTSILNNVISKDLADKYYWEIEGNKLKTAAGYSTWTSGNSANLDATGKELTIQQQTEGTYTFSFVDGDNTRYLALNKTAGNDYFAYYIGTNQIYRLTLVREGASGTITAIEDILPEEQSATKFLYNGQIYIRRGDMIYTLQGQLVK